MKITFKEFQEEYEWNILKQDDCVKTFDCGDVDLNNFIINEATEFSKALLAVTYVVKEKSPKEKNHCLFQFSCR